MTAPIIPQAAAPAPLQEVVPVPVAFAFTATERVFRMQLQRARSLVGRITPQNDAIRQWQNTVREIVRLAEIAPETFERLLLQVDQILREHLHPAPPTHPEVLETAPRRAVRGALASLRNAAPSLPLEDPLVTNLAEWQEAAERDLHSHESGLETFQAHTQRLHEIIETEHAPSFLAFLQRHERAPPVQIAPHFARFFLPEEQDAVLERMQRELELAEQAFNTEVAMATAEARGVEEAQERVEALLRPQPFIATQAEEQKRTREVHRKFLIQILANTQSRIDQLQPVLDKLDALVATTVEEFMRIKQEKETLEKATAKLKDDIDKKKAEPPLKPPKPDSPEITPLIVFIVIMRLTLPSPFGWGLFLGV